MLRTLTGPFNGANSEERVPCFPPVGKTGVTGKMATTTIAGPETGGPTIKRGLLFRNCNMPLWYDRDLSTIEASICAVTYSSSSRPVKTIGQQYEGTVTSEPLWINNQTYVASGGVFPSVTNSTPLYSRSDTGMQSFWPTMMDEQLPGSPFIFVPDYWRYTFVTYINAPAAGGFHANGNVEYEVWKSPGEVETFSKAAPGVLGVPLCSTADSFSTTGFWVRPRATTIDIGGLTITNVSTGVYTTLVISTGVLGIGGWTDTSAAFTPTLSTTANVNHFNCLIPVAAAIPEQHMTAAQVMLDNTIHHSTHLVLENITKVLNKEGTINAAQVNLAVANPWAISVETAAAGVDPLKRYFGAAEHGLVAYVEPAGVAAKARNTRHFYNYFNDGINQINYYPLVVGLTENCVMFSIFDGDVSTVSTFATTIKTGWEFVSNYQIFPTAVTRLVTLDFERALISLSRNNPFRRFEGVKGMQELQPRSGKMYTERKPKKGKAPNKEAAKPKPKAAKPAPAKPQPKKAAAPPPK